MMNYAVEQIYRRNHGGSRLIPVQDEQTIPDKAYPGCIFYRLTGGNGHSYFAKRRDDKGTESREVAFMLRTLDIHHVVNLVEYAPQSYGIIMPYLDGYDQLFRAVRNRKLDGLDEFKAVFKRVYDILESLNVLHEIDLHPGNVMVRINGNRITDFKIIDLEPMACDRSGYTLKKVLAL